MIKGGTICSGDLNQMHLHYMKPKRFSVKPTAECHITLHARTKARASVRFQTSFDVLSSVIEY